MQLGKKDLRKFAIALCIVLSIVGTVLLCHDKIELCKWFYGASAIALLMAILTPYLLKPVYLVMMKISLCIGRVVTIVILSILFYIVFTSIGLMMRVLR
jgi:hypothetical protein